MADRFYVPDFAEGAAAEVTDDEFHHLAHVLRKRTGDVVSVFDGCGRTASATVAAVGRRSAALNIGTAVATDGVPACRIEIATAMPKGDRARWMIEKLTELGVDAWTPLQTERSVVDPRAGKLEKLQQTVIAACKQCGRNHLMALDVARPWTEWVDRNLDGSGILVADPGGMPIKEALRRLTAGEARPPCVRVAVGPEGGLSDEELQTAINAGAELVSLSQTILRIETAAVAAAAIVRACAESI